MNRAGRRPVLLPALMALPLMAPLAAAPAGSAPVPPPPVAGALPHETGTTAVAPLAPAPMVAPSAGATSTGAAPVPPPSAPSPNTIRLAQRAFSDATAASGYRMNAGSPWQLGLVLDVGATSRELALGMRQQGLGLGHSDISAQGGLGRHLDARITLAAHHHHDELEAHLEELWVQSRLLPHGLSLRLGRMASGLSPLNEQHPHADDFAERPLAWRAFLGGHWFDDGLRLGWTAPTRHYVQAGMEVFRGRQLIQSATPATGHHRAATGVLWLRSGGDLGMAHSWQASVGWLYNRRVATEDAHHHHHGHGADDGHDHAGHLHAHGAAFSGRRLWLAEINWKWAPEGNNHRQQLRLHGAWVRVTGLTPATPRREHHDAGVLSLVWRFRPDGEVGVRHERLQVQMPHNDHFHPGRLRETALMLAWKPSHRQALRLQFSRQHDAVSIVPTHRSVMLHYVIGFGAHEAHAF